MIIDFLFSTNFLKQIYFSFCISFDILISSFRPFPTNYIYDIFFIGIVATYIDVKFLKNES